MAKKRYVLFARQRSSGKNLGWYGFRGVFHSQQAAEKNLYLPANKKTDLAEIVEMDTLKVIKVLRKGKDGRWQ